MNFMIARNYDDMFFYFTGYDKAGDANFDDENYKARKYSRYENALKEIKENASLGSSAVWIQPTDDFFSDPSVSSEEKATWRGLHPAQVYQRQLERIRAKYTLTSELGESQELKGSSCELILPGRKFEVRQPCMLAECYGLSHKTAFSLRRSIVDSLKDAPPLMTVIFAIQIRGFKSSRATTVAEINRLVSEAKAPIHQITRYSDYPLTRNLGYQFQDDPNDWESFYIFDSLWFSNVEEVFDSLS